VQFLLEPHHVDVVKRNLAQHALGVSMP
jgi:hypothetical protein